MRGINLQFLMVVVFLSLTSCSGRSETVHFDNAEYEPYTPREHVTLQEIPVVAEEIAVADEYVEEISVEDVCETTLPSLVTTSIIGCWTFEKVTESYQLNGTETETPFVYIDWLSPTLQVFSNNSFHIVVYGSLVGDVIQIAQDKFLLVNQIATAEGETWYPHDEKWLRYFPESGLLRYSFFNEFSNRYIHYYFARV